MPALLSVWVVVGAVGIGAAVILCWFCFHNTRTQLLDMDRQTGRRVESK